jgi:WD40 repeat protein
LERIARLFRFRLATFFIVVGVLCGWLAWTFHREPLSPENVRQLRVLQTIPCEGIFKLVYSKDRNRIAFISWEKPVVVRETVTLWKVRTVGADRKLIGFDFAPDQRHVVYCDYTNGTRVEILNLESGKTLELDTGGDQPDVVFSPDGRLLATGSYGMDVRLWDPTTGELVRKLDCGTHAGGLTIVFSPDGKTIVVGNRNSITKLFDVATGRLLREFPAVYSHELAFHPTQPLLAVGYATGDFRLWNTTTGKLLAEHKNIAEEIYTLDWSPNGELLASAGLKGDICIWNKDLKLLHKMPAPEWTISVKFSPDGTRLVTAGGLQSDKTQHAVTIWGVRPTIGQLWRR